MHNLNRLGTLGCISILAGLCICIVWAVKDWIAA